jgi:hypothetical protein
MNMESWIQQLVVILGTIIVQKLMQGEPVSCSVDVIWKACKNMDKVLRPG